MRMGEVDVFPCVSRSASFSLSLCRECNHDQLAPSSAHSQKGAKQKIVLDIFFTFTFLMQEKHCLSFAFDYTMFIKLASGSLITLAVWPHPTACVFNQGVWKQSSHSDSARHLNLVCGALTYGCKLGSGIHKQPKATFSVRSLYGTVVWENELRGRQSEQNRDVLSTHAQTDTHERPPYICQRYRQTLSSLADCGKRFCVEFRSLGGRAERNHADIDVN